MIIEYRERNTDGDRCMMQYSAFRDSLAQSTCPEGLDPCLQALWHAVRGDWDTAHRIVQVLDGAVAARIHACLHRQEDDDSNARYWHRQAGSTFPAGMSLEAEWDALVQELTR